MHPSLVTMQRGRGRSRGPATLARVLASDFADGELVGDGATFTNATTGNRPTAPGGVVTFDAPGENLVWTPASPIDMTGKTMFIVTTVTNGVTATNGLIGLRGDGVSYDLVTRAGNQNFNARSVGAGIGFEGNADSNNRGTAVASYRNLKTVFAISFTETECIVTGGSLAGARIPLSGGSRTITSIVLGHPSASVYFTFNEFLLLDSAADDEVNTVFARIALDHSVTYCPRTLLFRRPMDWYGDSTAASFRTDTGDADGLDREGIRDYLWADYLPLLEDRAVGGSYLAPGPAAEGAQITGSWSEITASVGNFSAGTVAVMVMAGLNDHRTGRPLGTIADTSGDVSIYGGIREGLNNVRANLGPDVKVCFFGPQYYGAEQASDKSTQDIRDAMAAVAATDPNAYFIETNAVGLGDPPLNVENWAYYTTPHNGTADNLHPNGLAQLLAWDVAKPGMDAVLI